MDLKLERSLFRKNQEENVWIATEAEIGFELIVPDRDAQPDSDSLALAQSVVDRLKELKNQAVSVLRSKLTFQGECIFEGFRILPQPDRHGARIILNFTNAEDAYLWIEAGVTEDRIARFRVEYCLATYH